MGSTYLAARLRSDELDQRLIDGFRSAAALNDSPSSTQEHGFLAVLFDAVIESGITVPAPLLAQFEKDWAGPVLILLARDKDAEDLLLPFRGEKSRDPVWLAANNLLFQRRSQRWYSATLSEITLTHRFTVTDSRDDTGFGGGQGGGLCGDGIAAMPKGFPPVSLYTLQDVAEPGSVLLMQGPQNAYYKRTIVPTDKQVGFGSCALNLDRMAIQIGYLAQLGHESDKETERIFHRDTHIQFIGTEQFQREVEQMLSAQEQDIRAFIQVIEERGLRAASIHLQIVPEVNDKRRGTTVSLPFVAPRVIDLP
jgi:hypothetical protein